ncbi:MAG TPA: hypothetical protein VMF06_12445 [Candidatus Limnocylindria bacterium]|nr:hypothetical protein [Candidatus Limnocylindria bacterium]
MTYALLQTSMTQPPMDALQRAFRSGVSLSSADAAFVADDAFGILARDLPEEDAQSIAASLANEGIDVEMVAEGDLPRLPDAQFFVSAHFSEMTLDLFDGLERKESAPWGALSLIAVGFDQKDVRVEIVAGDALIRYHSHLNRMRFHHSPEATGRSASERLEHFIQGLVAKSPRAFLNRGAAELVRGNVGERMEEVLAYPRLSAFHEEMIWLLWKARQADQSREAGE